MTIELYCFFDVQTGRCKCGADGKDRPHEWCKYHMGTGNGRPCAHLRGDHAGACDNAYANHEAFAFALKMEGDKNA
jgi:hypothetical protein